MSDKPDTQEHERLMCLAIKHCPKDHHDWKEILELTTSLSLTAPPVVEQELVDGPTEAQVYRWFGESTILHHIKEDGSHISARANYLAQQAWSHALQSPVQGVESSLAEMAIRTINQLMETAPIEEKIFANSVVKLLTDSPQGR